MTSLERWALSALLWGATCLGCAHPKPPQLAPFRIPGFAITPPPLYAQWFAEAHNCAFRLRAIMGDSAAGFTVDETAVDLQRITWIAVPSERPDGRFVGAMSPKGAIYVSGMTSAQGDTIWLSAQQLQSERLVKHEAMHVFVHSVGEMNYGDHGNPWGFCEHL